MKKISLSPLLLLLLSVFIYSAANSNNNNDKTKTLKKEEPKVGVNIGDKAPELAFENPEGKILKLSDLKGKIVLIDFWASWCGPCRRENPNVVSAYNKYKNAKFKEGKGFEIFSVSLDGNKEKWVQAIEQDQLSWKYHVSDLAAWASQGAKIYGVTGIPASFLIDKNGIIIAKNLRQERLHMELDKLVQKL